MSEFPTVGIPTKIVNNFDYRSIKLLVQALKGKINHLNIYFNAGDYNKDPPQDVRG